MYMSCDVVPGCKVVDAAGRRLAELGQEQGEGFALAEVSLAETRPVPVGPQPPSRVSLPAYLLSDGVLPALCRPDYRRGVRQAWGPGMAPVDAAAQRRRVALVLALAAGLVVGWFLRHNKRKR
jgi:hypothetical protein